MTALSLAPLTLNASPTETIDAAAAAGFRAAGVRICARRPGESFDGPELLGQPATARALRRRAADAGVRLHNILGYQFFPEVSWDDLAPVIETTHELGVPFIVVNSFDSDGARFLARFTQYCDAARKADISIALEFMPFSGVRTLAAAMGMLRASGAPNAGVILDSLHLDRAGLLPRDIATVPPDKIAFAQLCDARRLSRPMSDAELLEEARWARLPAGEGELPLFDFLDALPSGLDIEYEAPRADLAQCSAHEKARAAFADARRFMQGYDEHRERRAAAAAEPDAAGLSTPRV